MKIKSSSLMSNESLLIKLTAKSAIYKTCVWCQSNMKTFYYNQKTPVYYPFGIRHLVSKNFECMTCEIYTHLRKYYNS